MVKRRSLLTGISIHAPSRERPFYKMCIKIRRLISIHAPSRERQNIGTIPRNFILFQSTLPRGSDLVLLVSYKTKLEFQSTLPRGSDWQVVRPAVLWLYFNPRSLAGATPQGSPLFAKLHISIHAPSRERLNYSIVLLWLWNFNPRSLAGATICYW